MSVCFLKFNIYGKLRSIFGVGNIVLIPWSMVTDESLALQSENTFVLVACTRIQWNWNNRSFLIRGDRN